MTFVFVYFADELQSSGVRRGTKRIRPIVPRGFTRETRPASRENPCASKEEVTRGRAALNEGSLKVSQKDIFYGGFENFTQFTRQCVALHCHWFKL